jgi:uncharacterized protein
MLIVADSSALLTLAACESLSLLDQLFDKVRVPPAVFLECTVAGKPGAEVLETYLRDRVEAVDLEAFVIAAVELGRGELEAMALYKRLRADRLLVDDLRARRVARLNSIAIIGSIGVLLLAKEEGHLAAVRPRLEAIRNAGIHLSEQLIADALELAGEAPA